MSKGHEEASLYTSKLEGGQDGGAGIGKAEPVDVANNAIEGGMYLHGSFNNQRFTGTLSRIGKYNAAAA